MKKLTEPTRIISPLLSTLLAIGIFLKTGWNLFPSFHYMFQLSANFPSLHAIESLAQYNFYSLGPYVTVSQFGLGPNSLTKAVFFILIIACVLLTEQISRGENKNRLIFVVFLCSPALMILLSWVGSYDVFTLATFLVVLYSRKRYWAVFAGIIAAWSNFEQFIFAGLILVTAIHIIDRNRIRQFKIAAVSAVSAYVFLRIYLDAQGVSETRPTGQMKLLRDPEYFSNALNSTLPVLLTILSGTFVIFIAWIYHSQPSTLQVLRLVFGIALVLATAMIALDQTRIGAILILPISLLLSEEVSQNSSIQQSRKLSRLLILFAFLTPPIFVWSYKLHLIGWDNLRLN
jgi:uncharacterized membrane protein YozB (DUF420 family)